MPTTIVIVDDQKVHREVMERLVRDAVAPDTPDIFDFEDPRSAWDYIAQNMVDLVLTDLAMDPEYDGFRLLATLKSHPATREIPVVVVSRSEDAEVIAAAFKAGASDFWKKSEDRAMIKFRIRSIFRMYEKVRETQYLHNENDLLRRSMSDHQMVMMMESQAKALDSEKETRDAKNLFVAMVSHEFRTPLQSIVSTVDSLTRRLSQLDIDEDDLETLRPSMRRLQEDTRHLMVQAQDLSDFVLTEADRAQRHSEPIMLAEFIDDLVIVYSVAAAEKGITLSVSVKDERIVVDKTRLRQIVSNLVSNAVKYTKQGEVVVSISVFDVESEPERRILSIVVDDTGIGIPEELQAKIFDPWVRAPQGRSERGMGLGLSVVERLVTALKGRIQLESTVDPDAHGTRVTVQLPLARVTRTVIEEQPAGDGGTALGTRLSRKESFLEMSRPPAELPLPDRVDIALPIDAALVKAAQGSQGSPPPQAPIRPSDARIADVLPNPGRRHSDGSKAQDSAAFTMANLITKVTQTFRNDGASTVDGSSSPARPVTRPDSKTRSSERPSQFDNSAPVFLPMRTLLVDDILNIREAMRDMLQDAGAFVAVAEDGQSALELMRNAAEPWELVLVDLSMPGMNGYEVAHHIRRMKLASRPILVGMSAYKLDKTADQDGAAGRLFDVFVEKPVTLADLVERITLWLNERSSNHPAV